MRNCIDLIAGILFFKFRNENIHQGLILCGLRTVVMPKVDRNRITVGGIIFASSLCASEVC